MNHYQRTQTNYFRLSPPLPISAARLGQGLAHYGNQHELVATFADTPSEHPSECRIEISLSPSITCSFQATFEPSEAMNSGCYRIIPATVADKSSLQDTIAKIRKDQHISICEHLDVEASDRDNGLGAIHFLPHSLPDLDWNELDTRQEFLGQTFDYPFLITGMTGGVERGEEINRRLAAVAAAYKIPMGVGSQRVALEAPCYERVFDVKKYQPDVFLIGNLGIAQLQHQDAGDLAQRAVDMIQADALAIHINVIQELIQVEGDRNFANLLEKIELIAKHLTVPLMVKECGSGMDPKTAHALRERGVKAIDVGGKGGTSWGHIEGLRSSSKVCQDVAATFRDWGIPTGHAVAALQSVTPDLALVATGGIRTGLDIAKTVALGATMAGIGLPFFRAALVSEEQVAEVAETFAQALKITMMATNSKELSGLSKRIELGRPFAGALQQWFTDRDEGYGTNRS